MPLQVDNLIIYDPEFEGTAKQQNSQNLGAVHAVRSWADIVYAMQAFCLVKFVTFITHGLPGLLCPPDGAQIAGLDFAVAKVGPTFMQKNGRILFSGCNIGADDAGDLFLDETGQYLLRGKGGFVGATTEATFATALFGSWTEMHMVPLSFGRLKVYRYSESGKRIAQQITDRQGFVR